MSHFVTVSTLVLMGSALNVFLILGFIRGSIRQRRERLRCAAEHKQQSIARTTGAMNQVALLGTMTPLVQSLQKFLSLYDPCVSALSADEVEHGRYLGKLAQIQDILNRRETLLTTGLSVLCFSKEDAAPLPVFSHEELEYFMEQLAHLQDVALVNTLTVFLAQGTDASLPSPLDIIVEVEAICQSQIELALELRNTTDVYAHELTPLVAGFGEKALLLQKFLARYKTQALHLNN